MHLTMPNHSLCTFSEFVFFLIQNDKVTNKLLVVSFSDENIRCNCFPQPSILSWAFDVCICMSNIPLSSWQMCRRLWWMTSHTVSLTFAHPIRQLPSAASFTSHPRPTRFNNRISMAILAVWGLFLEECGKGAMLLYLGGADAAVPGWSWCCCLGLLVPACAGLHQTQSSAPPFPAAAAAAAVINSMHIP